MYDVKYLHTYERRKNTGFMYLSHKVIECSFMVNDWEVDYGK